MEDITKWFHSNHYQMYKKKIMCCFLDVRNLTHSHTLMHVGADTMSILNNLDHTMTKHSLVYIRPVTYIAAMY